MAINRAKVATERQKMKLQADILNLKVKSEENRIQLTRKREELRNLKQTVK